MLVKITDEEFTLLNKRRDMKNINPIVEEKTMDQVYIDMILLLIKKIDPVVYPAPCACMGPKDGDPLCPCRMNLYHKALSK